MEQIDFSVVENALQELSPDAPCGADLEYDPAFLEFEQAARGKPEDQIGDTITPAILPEWKTVAKLATDLTERTRDLRICVPYARALMHLQGIGGLATGLALIERLLAERWDSLHPQLDPEDDNDPMSRINTLSALCENGGFLREFRELPLIDSRVHGRFALREFDLATGETEAEEGKERPSLAHIETALDDMGAGYAENAWRLMDAACASLGQIETILTDRVGSAQAIDLGPLRKPMQRARNFFSQRMAASAVAPEGSSPGDEPAAEVGAVQRPRGEVSSRADVLQQLDKICRYYQENEPASPVPLLLRRAHRLAGMSFLEILADLAPEALQQVHVVSGQPAVQE